MTNPSDTHITLVVDRSGSMANIADAAEAAVNAFIKEQKRQPGECSLYLVDFDAPGPGSEVTWYTVHHDGHIDQAKLYNLHPRGATALRDAIGRAITETGEKLARLPEDLRPGTVIFVAQTDGMENSSREWTQEAIKKAIAEHTEKYAWDFVFLGTGPASWGQGQQLGFQNVASAAAGPIAYAATYEHLGASVNARRGGNVVAMATMNVAVDEGGEVSDAE